MTHQTGRGRTAHIVHGFNVSDGGKRTIDTIIPFLKEKGYKIQEFDYGWTGLLGVRFWNKNRARKLLGKVHENDVVIGHSNGCAIIALAMKMEMWVHKAVFIHPALNRNWKPPVYAAKFITVYYSEKDKATWASKYLINHIWGDMGTVGPQSIWRGWISVDDGMAHSEGFQKDPGMYVEEL